MISLIITAIGTVLFVMYALGITGDGIIMIVGGLIFAELAMLVDILSNVHILDEYNQDDGTDIP